jgi:hypothetical protein
VKRFPDAPNALLAGYYLQHTKTAEKGTQKFSVPLKQVAQPYNSWKRHLSTFNGHCAHVSVAALVIRARLCGYLDIGAYT